MRPGYRSDKISRYFIELWWKKAYIYIWTLSHSNSYFHLTGRSSILLSASKSKNMKQNFLICQLGYTNFNKPTISHWTINVLSNRSWTSPIRNPKTNQYHNRHNPISILNGLPSGIVPIRKVLTSILMMTNRRKTTMKHT